MSDSMKFGAAYDDAAWSVVLFSLTFIFYALFFTDIKGYDIWWHLKTGESILAGHFPKVDIFSYTAAGRKWILHEWGSEVIFYLLYSKYGYSGLIWLKSMAASSATMLVFLTFRGIDNRRQAFWLPTTFTLVTMVCLHKTWGLRPQLFSMPLFLLLIYIISRRRNGQQSRLFYTIPLIFLVWINLHGGFFIGFIFMGICLLAPMIENTLRHRKLCIDAPLLAVISISALVCMVNPNGLDGLTYPLAYRSHDQIPINFIAEWYPASMTNSRWYLLFLLSLLMVWFRRTTHTPLVNLILILFFNFYALKHHRLTANAAAVTAPLVYPAIIDGLMRMKTGISNSIGANDDPVGGMLKTAMRKKKGLRLLGGIFATVVLSITLMVFCGYGRMVYHAEIGKMKYPVTNLSILKSKPLDGNLFNQYRWGGLIIHQLPDKKVFIDGRIDMYGRSIADEYDTLLELTPGWKPLIDKYNITHVLVDKRTAMGKFLGQIAPEWKLVSEDHISVIYALKSHLK